MLELAPFTTSPALKGCVMQIQCMQTCRGKGRDNSTIQSQEDSWLFSRRRRRTHQRENSSHVQATVNKTRIIEEEEFLHVIYSIKITAFHCHVCTQNISSRCSKLVFHWLALRSCSKLLNHTHFGVWIGGRGKTLTCHRCGPGLNTGVPGIESWCRYSIWQDSGRPKSVVFSGYSGFLHHVRPQNANIRAFKNVFIRSLRFLCNRSKINSV